MDPGIWSTLPKELVELVFARLPVAHIFRLRVLSQEWNWNVTAPESAFRNVYSAIQYKIFGLAYEGYDWGICTLQFYDPKSRTWHTVENVGRFPESPLATLGATDGGLVCWIERLANTKKHPLLIMVCNPLTMEFRQLQLPSGALSSAQPSMVQLVADGTTSKDNYKVIAAGRHEGVVYHAASDTWTSTATSTESLPGFVFGEEYRWELSDDDEDDDVVHSQVYETVAVALCAFACASSQLLDLRDDSYPCAGPSFRGYALVKDRLFVLLDGGTDQRRGPVPIADYHGRRMSPHWIKVGEYCSSINLDVFSDAPDRCLLRLYACEGFLLISATMRFRWDNPNNAVKPRVAQFYDFSTGKWEGIPGVPENDYITEEGTMCEVRLDAFP